MIIWPHPVDDGHFHVYYYSMSLVLLGEESTNYVRTSTHTNIRADDPERDTLMSFGNWSRLCHLRLWLATLPGELSDNVHITQYLGTIPIWEGRDIDKTRVKRLISRLVQTAPKERLPQLCRQFRNMLRRSS